MKKKITAKWGNDEVHKLGGASLSVFVRTRENVACYAAVAFHLHEEKVKYESLRRLGRTKLINNVKVSQTLRG